MKRILLLSFLLLNLVCSSAFAVTPPSLLVDGFINTADISGAKVAAVRGPASVCSGNNGIAYVYNSSASQLQAYDEPADTTSPPVLRWTRSIPNAEWKSGFLFNGDCKPDVAVINKQSSAGTCTDGSTKWFRQLFIYSGDNNSALMASASVPDDCVPINGSLSQAYVKIATNSFHTGPFAGITALMPQYHTQGWFYSSFLPTQYFFPPAWFNFADYTASQSLAYPGNTNGTPETNTNYGGPKWLRWGQPMNGLVIDYGGGVKYVGATSQRFLEYYYTLPYGTNQLKSDATFTPPAGQAGRTYGLLQHDRFGNTANVMLIPGTGAEALNRDFVLFGMNTVTCTGGNSTPAAPKICTPHDLAAGIERRAIKYSLATGSITERSEISYMYNNGNRDTFTNRVTYPSLGFLPSTNSAGSRLIYNQFDGFRWQLRITSPGGLAVAIIINDRYVWDVIPRANGEVDIVTSPINTGLSVLVPDDIDLPWTYKGSYYFPQWKTEIYRWCKTASATCAAADSLNLVKTLNDEIPWMDVAMPNQNSTAASPGYVFGAVRMLDVATRTQPQIVMRNSSNSIVNRNIDW